MEWNDPVRRVLTALWVEEKSRDMRRILSGGNLITSLLTIRVTVL